VAAKRIQPYQRGDTYPTTEVLKRMSEEEYEHHWQKIQAMFVHEYDREILEELDEDDED
jgi:hypothetical protein